MEVKRYFHDIPVRSKTNHRSLRWSILYFIIIFNKLFGILIVKVSALDNLILFTLYQYTRLIIPNFIKWLSLCDKYEQRKV